MYSSDFITIYFSFQITNQSHKMKKVNVCDNDELEIWKHESKKNSFNIQFKHGDKSNNNSLLKSIFKTNILSGTINDKIFTFKAHSIRQFYPFHSNNSSFSMNYETCAKLIYFLTTQLEFLIINEKKCFYKLIPSNIFIIDNSKFVYLSSEYLLDIHENKMTICCPFQKDVKLDSSELLEIITIPAEIHYKTVYYSLASLILYFLNINNEDLVSDTNTKILEDIKILEGTKLFYLLKRCLHSVPEKRSVLFI